MFKNLLTALLVLGLAAIAYADESFIHHDLNVKIQPENNFIHVKDKISIPANLTSKSLSFYLHGNMKLIETSENVETTGLEIDEESRIPLKKYSVNLLENTKLDLVFSISYEGKINHPIKQMSEEYSRGFSTSPGLITTEGVYLSGSTVWFPWFDNQLITFTLTVELPKGWSSVSQGSRLQKIADTTKSDCWESKEPMDDVYLIAAKFTEYEISAGKVSLYAFLRSPDKNLADKYLETTKQYLTMYEKLIGKYPYSKFALIENFWETGYGMPSFTLLGSKIIRFPFILHSSYPHELLHNWWGNSVYVDYQKGNWCEGITVYLADHLIREQHGQGVDYRRTTLQGFTDYVNEKNDFPVNEFRSRYNASSASIGYGKSMMLFHMLRYQVGDKLFAKALQKFYVDNKFKKSSFDDIRIAFELVTGQDFKDYFAQWVTRKGAPEISLINVNSELVAEKHKLSFNLQQTQKGDAFELLIPVYFYFENEVIIKNVKMTNRNQLFEFSFDYPVLRIDIDPQYDVFRKLHFQEIPPTLSKAFGANEILIILPSKASKEMLDSYKTLANNWVKERSSSITFVMDNNIESFPINKAVWLFGWENKFRNVVAEGVKTYNASVNQNGFFVNGKNYAAKKYSIIISSRNPLNPSQVIVLMSADNRNAIPGLGRKLPHYGKYSYLAFEGVEPTNILKGQWIETSTPLNYVLNPDKIDKISKIVIPKRKPLAILAPAYSKENMLETVKYLSSKELKGRGLDTDEIKIAGKYIADKFKEYGLKPGGDKNTYFQTWKQNVGKDSKAIEMSNVIGIINGSKSGLENQAVILCAHYDHLGTGERIGNAVNKGKIHPGADDNASGIAVMLEIARKMSVTNPDRTIIFIAFTGEESGRLGSMHYVENLESIKLKGIIGVVNLYTVGRLGDNKLLVLGSSTAREWKFILMGIEYTAGIATELISQQLDSSDHVSFINAGVPAIQLFSGAHADYHKPTDTFDKIDGEGLVKVAAVAREIVTYLSQRTEPMTITIENSKSDNVKPVKSSRKVSTGIMPDFRFNGSGVKIASVTKDSPADVAGMKKGDIIIKLGDAKIENLKQYSDLLKKYKPGDVSTVEYMRAGEVIKSKITFKTR